MPRLRCVIIVGSMVSTALLGLALPATAAPASTGPRLAPAGQVTSPTVSGSNDFFNSDSCTGAFCMAVGGYTRSGHTHGLSDMLSASNWVAEPVPSPSHGGNIFANEVSCPSAASCLFVGQHWAGKRGLPANLAEAWNGSSWRIVSTTGPARTDNSGLNDVACPTTSFCLAIGSAGTSRTHYQDTAYTWKNGTTWRRLAVPRPSRARNSELGGLACFSPGSCMAVGNYTSASGHVLSFAVRWHDGRWKLLTAPAIRGQRLVLFQAISCPTATRCVAVGNTEDNTRGRYYHAFAEVWNAGKWHLSTLRRAPSGFIGVSCPARNRCFASGVTFSSQHVFALPLIEAWNGLTWKAQHPVETSAPNVGDSLQHVSCVTQYDCEAVGYSFNPAVSSSDQTLAEYWNGEHWTVQTTPNP